MTTCVWIEQIIAHHTRSELAPNEDLGALHVRTRGDALRPLTSTLPGATPEASCIAGAQPPDPLSLQWRDLLIRCTRARCAAPSRDPTAALKSPSAERIISAAFWLL